jgi:hypothetical protein
MRIEENRSYVAQIKGKFHNIMAAGKLRVKGALITRENITVLSENDLIVKLIDYQLILMGTISIFLGLSMSLRRGLSL